MHTRTLGYQNNKYERKEEKINFKKYFFLISKIEKICNVKHFFSKVRLQDWLLFVFSIYELECFLNIYFFEIMFFGHFTHFLVVLKMII